MTEAEEQAPGLSITIKRLAFDDLVLLEDLQLDLRPGEWTCLLGDGGTGKSTLLRIAAGQDVGAGSYGAVLSDGRPAAKFVALMAGQAALEAGKTVLENACGDPMQNGIPIANLREEAKDLLQAAGLGERMEDPTAILSTGMRQRVALVRTLLTDRPIILLDEPFAALDRATRLHIQDLAVDWLKGCTVLHVTGDPWEAIRLAHRIVLLAGHPACLHEHETPPGLPPRLADQPGVEEHANALFARLLAPSA
jgi:putative hydroxymethylpyrimidine transport system ATP-binding protein